MPKISSKVSPVVQSSSPVQWSSPANRYTRYTYCCYNGTYITHLIFYFAAGCDNCTIEEEPYSSSIGSVMLFIKE